MINRERQLGAGIIESGAYAPNPICTRSLANSTRSSLIAGLALAACALSSLIPSAVWPEAVLTKEQVASPSLYLGSVTSNQYPSSKQVDCPPTAFSCLSQTHTGPVPAKVKSSFANALHEQGLTVLMDKPSQGIFNEVSVSLSITELPSSPPTVPKRFVCDVEGRIDRRGSKGKQPQAKGFRDHAIPLQPSHEDKSGLVFTCLEPAASIVKKTLER